jgi:hypothetical protein
MLSVTVALIRYDMGDHTENFAVERAYMRLLHEIDKAMTEGDDLRAQAMARRGALGDTKVLPRMLTPVNCDPGPQRAT